MVLRIGLFQIRLDIQRLQERAADRRAPQSPERFWNESRDRALRHMMAQPWK